MSPEVAQDRPVRWAPPFFTIWTAQIFSLLGSMLVQFALVWWLTQTTGSATVLATATLVAILPSVFIGPVAGTLVDRWNRRAVMIAADGLIALTTAGLIVLFAAGMMQVWHVYVAMFLRAALGGFHWPAMQASTSLMVPKAHLPRVAGMNQTLQGAMNIVSPPLGALLLGVLPLHGVLAIDLITAAIAITPLFFIKVPQPAPPPSIAAAPDGKAETAPGARRTSVWQEFGAGLRYVTGWPGLLAIIILAMVINFVINPAFALLPILVTKHFGGGAPELGWIDSAWGMGVVAGGLTLSAWGGFRRRVVTSMCGLVGMGLGSVLLGLAPANAFWLGLGAMFLTGFMNPITNGPLIAVMQTTVAPEMQGRVLSLVQSGAAAMMPLSLLIAGPLADRLGVQVWYVVGGIVCILSGIVATTIPVIMHVEDNGYAVKAENA